MPHLQKKKQRESNKHMSQSMTLGRVLTAILDVRRNKQILLQVN